MMPRHPMEAAIFDQMVAALRGRIESHGAGVGGLLSLPPDRPRAPSLAFPETGTLGRVGDDMAGPCGPTMKREGAEISLFGETWGGSGDGKSRGPGVAAVGESVRNQHVTYPLFLFRETGESREGI